MPKFVARPVVIEAEQFTGAYFPKGLCESRSCFLADKIHVHTTHGKQPVIVEKGDYIIPEPDGNGFYPCKPDIFEAKYEPATDDE